jgi:hypothetical protein
MVRTKTLFLSAWRSRAFIKELKRSSRTIHKAHNIKDMTQWWWENKIRLLEEALCMEGPRRICYCRTNINLSRRRTLLKWMAQAARQIRWIWTKFRNIRTLRVKSLQHLDWSIQAAHKEDTAMLKQKAATSKTAPMLVAAIGFLSLNDMFKW